MAAEEIGIPPKDCAVEGILWHIHKKRLGAGDRLPGERELCELIGVSRTALRAAILQLVSKGALESRHGSGTYVRHQKPLGILQGAYSYSDAVRRAGLTPSSRMVYRRVFAADEELAMRMELELGAPVFEMRRVRLADGEPVSIETTFISDLLCPGLSRFDFEIESMYAVLDREYGVRVAHGDERISITHLNEEEASLLGAKVGMSAFFERSIERDAEKKVVEYTKSLILPDRFQFASCSTFAPVQKEVDDAWLKS